PLAAVQVSGCGPGRGCVTSVNCKIACRTAEYDRSQCITKKTCATDGDCVPGRCATRKDAACTGDFCANNPVISFCTLGRPGDHCIDADDCQYGHCKGFDNGFVPDLTCGGDGSLGTARRGADECASGICVRQGNASVCSDGNAGDACVGA